MKRVCLDINDPVFLTAWFALPASESQRVLDMLRKIGQLSWEQLYADRGLRWEAVILPMIAVPVIPSIVP